MKKAKCLLAVALTLTLFSAPVLGQKCTKTTEQGPFTSTLVLTQRFITTYKNRALLTTNVNVGKHSPLHRIGRSGEDGDIHIAGRDTVAKLPFVAEIMNARYFLTLKRKFQIDFMALLKDIKSTERIRMTGVWRLWFEHPGKTQIMGNDVPLPTGSSPDHVFELHPVTDFRGENTLASLIAIKNYKEGDSEPESYDAHAGSKSVRYYECLPSTITARSTDDGKAGISIASKKAQYNYTELFIELSGKPTKYEDCYIGLADIYDSRAHKKRLTPAPRRMIFVPGSPPAATLAKFRKGTRLRVLGIPRINLSAVFEVAKKSKGKPETVRLPYEIIVAALLEKPE